MDDILDKLFDVEGAFGHPVTVWVVIGIGAALLIAPLVVDGITPSALTPGKYLVTLTGSAFTRKPKIRFENGEGKRPRAKVLRVLDENTLEVKLKIKHKNLYGPTRWDMRVRMKDGREVLVRGALDVEPL